MLLSPSFGASVPSERGGGRRSQANLPVCCRRSLVMPRGPRTGAGGQWSVPAQEMPPGDSALLRNDSSQMSSLTPDGASATVTLTKTWSTRLVLKKDNLTRVADISQSYIGSFPVSIV